MNVQDIFTSVAGVLVHVAPSVLFQKERPRNASPPRYVWIPHTLQLEPPSNVGGNPTSIGDDLSMVAIECWGRDYENAYRLRQALMTAIRNVMRGHNYEPGITECGTPDDMSLGFLMIVNVAFRIPLFEALIPGADGEAVVDDTHTTVLPEIIEWSPMRAAEGDGILDPTE